MIYDEEIKYEKLKNQYTHKLIDLTANHIQTDILLLKTYISLMKSENALNKINYLALTVDEIKYLDEMLNINEKHKLNKCGIYLYLNNPTELNYDEYRNLIKSFNIYSVVVNGLVKTTINENDKFAKIIDSRLWYEYLKNLDKLTMNIEEILISDNDIEKKMFSILCKRIVQNVTYDMGADELFYKNKKYHSERATDEIIGVIDGKCVCRGYAGIVRDGCAILGINAIVVYGSNGIEGHAWNQIKLDGQWYNVDITWDANGILKNIDTYWFLTSDADFNRYGILTNTGNMFHKNYSLGRSNENICSTSVSKDKIQNYLNIEENKKRNWLEKITQKLREKSERGVKK